VVVVFADKSMTQKLIDAAGRHGVAGRFVWILCDAWSAASSHRSVDILLNSPTIGYGETTQQSDSACVQPEIVSHM
jgi:hypothetical protein